MQTLSRCLLLLTLGLLVLPTQAAQVRELADFAGVRSNSLIGYGLVVGLRAQPGGGYQPRTGSNRSIAADTVCVSAAKQSRIQPSPSSLKASLVRPSKPAA